MKRLAVIPSDLIGLDLSSGYRGSFLHTYYNPARFFDEVYLFAPSAPEGIP